MHKNKNLISIIAVVLCSSLIFPGGSALADTGSTISPTVSIFTPTPNNLLSGTVQIAAAVTPGTNAVANVQLLLDGIDLGSAITTADANGFYDYSWDTTKATNGNYYLSAEVTDTASLTSLASSVSVTVSNGGTAQATGLHPAIAMNTPLANVTISGTVTVSAAVTPGTDAVTSVQFTLDGKNLGAALSAPTAGQVYSINWNTATTTNGSHVLNAIVTDSSGLQISSLNDTIGVQNGLQGAVPTAAHANGTLINLSGTFYLIQNNMLVGITNPGILQSHGYSFGDAAIGTTGDVALPHSPANVTPADGALVKTVDDPTVYLIADQQRHGFTDPSVFFGLGYQYASVLVVTTPELSALSVGAIISSPTGQHLKGTDISSGGTVYWLDDNSRHPYASLADYNSWHITGDFSTVVPADQADLALPVAAAVVPRVKS